MIEFRFINLRSDRPRFYDPGDVFIGITADIEVVTDAGIIYTEPDFPVVELARALNMWLGNGAVTGADFEFDSTETPEPGWVWIRRAGNGWRIGSIHQDRIDLTKRRLEEVQSAIRQYIATLDREVRRKFGLDLDPYIRVGYDE